MPPTILIVEDEAPLVELLKYNVEALGYDVDVAMRGDEAETRASGAHLRSDPARLDAAGPIRHRALPSHSLAARDQFHPDHHAHRAW
jgi:CheY-like chemotaxis protein